ncbi:YtxH domain-containing protein [Kineococcus sp. R8]|uniref:YtxH domain-containing protein n=1 Tax=Kineococcus siccus TaxID=2696567 RepID=UPI0014127073|nr:YtxH domain-containing protein [Kineococcus siccus]NAZ82650.1 YtxH domain-containing protein [Kineococcus siccus]
MKGKALFLVAGATGYVLGARAGRERYEQISRAAGRLWGSPAVQTRVVDLEDKATGAAKQAGSKVQEQVSSAASSVVDGVKAKVSSGSSSDTGSAAAGAPVTTAPPATTPVGSPAAGTDPLGDQHHTRMPTD